MICSYTYSKPHVYMHTTVLHHTLIYLPCLVIRKCTLIHMPASGKMDTQHILVEYPMFLIGEGRQGVKNSTQGREEEKGKSGF